MKRKALFDGYIGNSEAENSGWRDGWGAKTSGCLKIFLEKGWGERNFHVKRKAVTGSSGGILILGWEVPGGSEVK